MPKSGSKTRTSPRHIHSDDTDVDALRLSLLCKRYGAVCALDEVSLRVGRGKAQALIGENGAGKSTLVRIVNGLARPDKGTVEVFGAPLSAGDQRAAAAVGIATVYQELSLISTMTVAENLYLGPAQSQLGRVTPNRRLWRHAESDLTSFGVTDIDPEWQVRDLSLAERQRVEIVKAVRRKPRVLFLDESTSALTKPAMPWFYRLVERLKTQGTTLIFVTHRLEEIAEVCDEVTILRNGSVVAQQPISELARDEMVRLMIGRSLEAAFPARRAPQKRRPSLEVRGLYRPGELEDVNFTLGRGELLGIAGLDGQGQLALFRTLFGTTPARRGKITLDNKAVRIRRPADAIRAGVGIGFVPEDRKTDGVLLSQPVTLTMALPALARLGRYGWVRPGRRRAAVRAAAEAVGLSPDVLHLPASSLSGGNQQKAVIGKWMVADSRLLLLYDPTRGVDVGAKLEIYRLMQQLADTGVSILFYSSELPEVINLADRVLVFYRNRIAGEFSGADQTEEAVMAAAIGHGSTT